MGRLKKLALTLCALAAVGTTLALLLRASAPQVPSDTWAPTGDMATNRAGSAAALLPDGRVLVTGGTDGTAVTSTAERYSPAAGSFLATPAMQDARANHSATLLADGRVLVAGGVGVDGHALASAEVYDGVSNSWTPVAPLYRARAGQTATLLADGRVLMAGGDDAGAAIDSLEVFDPVAGVFSQLASTLSSPRTGHAAALLGDGRVLLVGGFNGTNALASTDVFDARGGDTVSSGPSLGTARAGASATTLLDGTVFVAGGANDTAELGTTEIFNPATNAFAPGATLAVARQRHQAFLLPHNNNVLIVGGTQGGNAVATAELYQPWNYTMLPAGAPSVARAWTAGSALSYPADKTIRTGPNDGLLLLAGGSAKADASSPVKSAELYGFATVKTDKEDYAPGTTVTITGSGWQPGETVALTLVEQPLLDTHPLLPVTADGNGNITSTEFAPDEHDVNIKFSLTAYGASSQAQTTFSDSQAQTVTVTPGTVTVSPGGTAAYSVTVKFNGSSNACTTPLSITTPLPTGASALFNPSSPTTPDGSNVTSNLTISTTGATPLGSTTFTVLAGSGAGCQSGTATTTASLVVAAKKVGAVTVGAQAGGLTYGTGGSSTYVVAVNRNGATGTAFNADLSLTTILPTGVTALFSPSTVNFLAADTSKTSTLTLTTTAATPAAASTGFTVLASNPAVAGDSSTGNGALAVGKRPVTVTFTAADKTYDGNNTAAVSACVIATGKVGSDDVTCTVAGGTFASANASAIAQTVSATATLSGTAASNYTVTNPVTTTAKINKAAATIVVTPYTVTYDGHPHTATITSITGVNGETGATVGTVDVGNTTHTNASTYASDTWSFTGAANYQDIAPTTITDTINKATATVVVTPYTVTYDGQPHTAAITSITGVNGETGATVGTVNVANTTHTNAGTYVSDTWSFTGAANYQNITPTTITDTINKAIATVVVTPYTVTYDGQSHTAAITSITGINGETGAAVGSVDVSTTTHAAAGIYASDSWSFTGAANYQNIAATTITDTINKAPATVVVTPYSVTYDGLPHTAAITSITGVNGETGATVGSVDVSNTTHTNAGTYASDFWTFTGTANYQSIGATTITDTINQAATSTSVASDHNPAATGQLITYTATVTSGSGVPTGTVTFYDGATVLGTGALDVTGHATFATSSLTVGTHPISAAYGGSLNFSGSPSSALSQVVDTPPAAAADAFSMFQDTTLATGAPGVLANDNDAESASQTLTAVLVSGPTPATTSAFTLNANGSFTYTPAPGFTGTDSFTYKPFDGVLNGNTVTVSLTVLATGASPVAEADAYHTTKDTSLNVPAVDGVVNNDHSALPITAVLVAGPAHASAFALNADGSFSYTPNTGFAGFDSFTYKANDGSTDSNVQQVLIAVVAPAATLVANNDSYTVDQDGTLVKTAGQGVLGNDTGASGAELVLAPLYGTVALAADGSFTYTPAAGFNGVDSFLYRAVSDPDASHVAMVSIRVRATATFSNLSAPTIVYGTAMTTLSGKITAGSMVPPNTEHVSITLNGVTQDATIQSDGTFSTDFDTHALDVSSYTIAYSYAGDDTFTPANDNTKSVSVTKAPLSVTANDKSRIYGDANPAFDGSVVGLKNGDNITATFSTTATSASPAATYAITAALSDPDTRLPNYDVTYHDGTLTIGKATLTVTADAKAREYGDANPTFTASYTGFKNSENLGSSGVTGSPSLTTTATAASPVSGSPYAITAALGTLASGNYSFSFVDGALTLTKAPLTVTADDKSKFYDGHVYSPFTVSYGAFKNSETSAVLGGTLAFSGTAATAVNAGSYVITPFGLTSGNYAIVFHDGALTINKAPLTITANDKSKTYGGADPVFDVNYTGFVNSETSTALSGSTVFNFAGKPPTSYGPSTTVPVNAASYFVRPSGLTSGNYAITFAPGTYTINKATLTVTADSTSRPYGDANPTFTASYGGFQNGENLATSGVTGNPSLTTTATTASGIGAYPIAAALGTLAASNYTFTFVDGTLTITARGVTATADAKTKAYGDADPALTYQITSGSLINGDTFSGSLTRVTGETVLGGPYAIQQGTLSLSTNYGLTFVGANLTITARPIRIAAVSQTKTYGDADPILTFVVQGGGGLVNGDTQATAFTGSLTRAAGESVGTYAITQGTLTQGSNYTLLNFNPGVLTVTARAVAVTADAKTKAYGDADPALTYQITSGSLVNGDTFSGSLTRAAGDTVLGGPYAIQQGTLSLSTNYGLTFVGANLTITARPIRFAAVSLTKTYGDADPILTFVVQGVGGGLVSGDTQATAFTGSLTRAAGESVGTYAITQGTLTPGSNYTLLNFNPGVLTVTARAITVTANSGQTKEYGTAEPASFIYQVTSGVLQGADTFSGTLARDPGEAVGGYAITQGSLTAGGNYTLAYVGATFTITTHGIRIAAVSKTKTYGDADPTLTFVVQGVGGGLVNGDVLTTALTGSLTRAAGEGVGTYAITQGTLTPSGNYTLLNFNPGALTIATRALQVTANIGQAKVYGSADPLPFAYHVTSGSLQGIDVLSGAPTRDAGETVASYAIRQGSLTAGANYSLSFVEAYFAINRAPLTITASSATIPQGSPVPTITATYGGFVNGETPAVLATSPSCSTTYVPVSPAGNYPTSCNGAVAANYAIAYVPGSVMVTPTPVPTTKAPVAQDKAVAVVVKPFHNDDDDDDRHDHDEFDRRGHDGHGWDHDLGDDDDDDGEWEHDADDSRAVRITLSATDADSTKLAFRIVSAPLHGVLSRIRKVSCTPDGHGGTSCTARAIYIPTPHYLGPDSFTYKANDGTQDSNVATVVINLVPPFTTFTQGEWGSTSNGQNPGWFLATNFTGVYGAAGVKIGAGSKTLTFNGAAAIKNFLPAGGKAGVLTASASNPTSSKGGVFAGQVLALQLNVDFSAALKTRSGLGALVLTKGGLKGQTVAQVLTLANNVLGGGALPAGMSISDLSDIVSKINDNYDRGKEDDGYLK